jgi:hypothetical protein
VPRPSSLPNSINQAIPQSINLQTEIINPLSPQPVLFVLKKEKEKKREIKRSQTMASQDHNLDPRPARAALSGLFPSATTPPIALCFLDLCRCSLPWPHFAASSTVLPSPSQAIVAVLLSLSPCRRRQSTPCCLLLPAAF